ncbi:MAG: MBL fold metallo-hydrolase [Pseudomonadota bacterium]
MASLTRYAHGITAVDSALIRVGFDAVHVVADGERAAIVDTGTGHSVAHILEALSELAIDPDKVEYVFVTHVHLDHAGGAGALLPSLPNAKVVLHPRGARHLIDPVKLIAGSVAVYGEEPFRRMYGDIAPIPEARVHVAGDGERFRLGQRDLEAIHTEGHARHHYCLVDHAAQAIFTGDTFGVSYRELDTTNGPFIFPTTTPVHFDPPAAHASIDRLLAYRPHAMFLTHYSRVAEVERLARDLHVCLDGFVALAKAHADATDRTRRLQGEMTAYLYRRLDEHGVDSDSDRRRELLGPDIGLNVQGLEVWLERCAQ